MVKQGQVISWWKIVGLSISQRLPCLHNIWQFFKILVNKLFGNFKNLLY